MDGTPVAAATAWQIKNPVEHRKDVSTGPEQRRGQFSE
jgi:hypothetical protein